MKVKFVKLTPDAKMPTKAYDGDFCYDVYATSDAEKVYDDKGRELPNVLRYHTGIAYEMVRDNEELAEDFNVNFKDSEIILDIDGRARSSIIKTGLVLCNSTATLDEGYRGEVMFNFYRINKVTWFDKLLKLLKIKDYDKHIYHKGDKIGQIKIGFTIPMEFELCKELDCNTQRKDKGHGSSDENKKGA